MTGEEFWNRVGGLIEVDKLDDKGNVVKRKTKDDKGNEIEENLKIE